VHRAPPLKPERAPTKLSSKEARELDQAMRRLEVLAEEIASLETRLADPDLFARDAAAFQAAADRLSAANGERAVVEERWLELELKREALAKGGA
jgi:ATP-binding cassette subfamily F protein uup